MKRRFNRSSNRRTEKEENFWPSFADVMSTFALVMLFLVMIVFVKNIIISINLEDEQASFAQSQLELEAREIELADTEEELALITIALNKSKNEKLDLDEELKISENEKGDLESDKNSLTELLIILESKQKELEAKEDALQQVIIINSLELDDLRNKLQSISVLQADIFKKVQTSIEASLGEYNEAGEKMVIIGDNTNLYINSSLVFDSGSSTLSSAGKQILAELAIAFQRILEDEEVIDYIDSISVEGHTDSEGGTEFNRILSSERATNVLNYLMYANPDLENNFGEYFAASGFSEFRPIATNDTAIGRSENRRIEFSIKVKDDNVQKIIEEYLASTPNSGGS